MSDPVLIREDGSYLYTLPSVVDDIDLGVTHVIRGDDHVTNTGAQIALFRALGAEAPAFGHHNLLTTTTGEGLSKRSGALSIKALHEAGYEPTAVVSLAVLDRHLGSGRGRVFVGGDGGELRIHHRVRNRRRSSIRPNWTCSTVRLSINCGSKPCPHVSRRSAIDVSDPRAEEVLDGHSRQYREGRGCRRTGGRSSRRRRRRMPCSRATISPMPVRPSICLPDGEIGETTWGEWTSAVKSATGRKGRALVHAASCRAYRSVVRSRDCRSIASSGAGRNSGPTTLMFREPLASSSVMSPATACGVHIWLRSGRLRRDICLVRVSPGLLRRSGSRRVGDFADWSTAALAGCRAQAALSRVAPDRCRTDLPVPD